MALARQIAALLVLTGIFTSGAFAASADDYPARPVKIIVPFGAGGPTDVYARAIGEELRKSLHQP
ncbi:MAG: tripartite tricarboxylate transporter substrate binding protein, partial [Pseudolabrys sp.]